MYLEFWKLNQKPFENVSDVKFAYYARQHQEALARLIYCVKEKKNGALVTGTFGAGKTMVRDLLIHQLAGETDLLPVVLDNPVSDLGGLAGSIRERMLITLDKTYPDIEIDDGHRTFSNHNQSNPGRAFHQLQGLLQHLQEAGKHVAIMIDQAHLITSKDELEQLAMLMSLQFENKHPLVSLIFFGHDRLKNNLRDVPALTQRLPIRWHIDPLTQVQTEEYILHRMAIAGLEKQVYTRQAMQMVYRQTAGIPRNINNTCDLTLFLGANADVDFVDGDVVERVLQDLEQFDRMGALAGSEV